MAGPTLVVLAAGLGSRYGGLKQLDPVGPAGEVIVDYSVFDALAAGFGDVVFVINPAHEATFREKITNRFADRIPVAFAYQEISALPTGLTAPATREKPWGTGHAALVCRDIVRGPFAVINADDFYGRSAYRALADFLARPGLGADDYAMVAYQLRHTLSEHGSVCRGICTVGADGRLRDVDECRGIEKAGDGARYPDADGQLRTLSGDEATSMNLWGFRTGIFARLDDYFRRFLAERIDDAGAEFFLPAAVNDMIAAGEATVTVLPTDEEWSGVTYPDDKPIVRDRLDALMQAGVYPEELWA